PVEIARWNGVVLVIMAARATDGKSEEDGRGRSGDLAEIVLPDFVGDEVRAIPRSEAQKSDRHVPLNVRLVVVARAAVLVAAGELLNHEPVVGHVRLKRLDHPIAIAPGVADGSVAFEAAGFAVSNQIEPVAAPAFAVTRIFEQAVDKPRRG